MYKEKEDIPEFEKFYLPFGGHLNGENRWVKLSAIIPWDEIEKNYVKCFSKHIGRSAMPVRIAFGSLLIKEKLHLTDEETVEQIRENPYLQYFLGYEGYKDEKPFDPTMMVHFRRRLNAQTIGEINEIVAKRKKKDADGSPPNQGQLIIDATCMPQDIRHPHDVTLLDEARGKTEGIIDTLYAASTLAKRPRTYRRKARSRFLVFIRGRRRTKEQIRRAARIQLQYLRRNLTTINKLVAEVNLTPLSKKQRRDLMVINEIYRQQRELYRKKTHSIPGKIVSIAQPHVRPIARGKARAAFEFGAKISASVTEHGLLYVDRLSWEPYNEGEDLPMQVERYKERFGRYPESVHADKIYRTRDNLEYCKERNIRLSGPKLGRQLMRTEENKKRLRLLRKIEKNG